MAEMVKQSEKGVKRSNDDEEGKSALDWLRQYCTRHDRSIQEIAAKIGLNRRTLRAYLNGDRPISRRNIAKILKFRESTHE
jgi:hypothetical protein